MKLVLDANFAVHILKKGILPNEIDEAAQDPGSVTLTANDGQYFIFGQTAAGRYLVVVVFIKKDGYHVRTAWPMSEREKRTHKGRRKPRREDENEKKETA